MIGDRNATDTAVEQVIPPEQPPMCDAAGSATVDVENDRLDHVSTGDMSMQGGE